MSMFFITMLVIDLILPLIMIIFGIIFLVNIPKEKNYLEVNSKKMFSEYDETWQFAHRYYGKLSTIIGLLLIPITVIAMLFLINKSQLLIGVFGIGIMIVEGGIVLLPIIPVKRAVKNEFDEFGCRK